VKLNEMSTPVLWADVNAFERNLATMADAWPGVTLRPHVKAHKTTRIAARQAELGHTGFTCATPREVIGLAEAGLGEDLLLANETVDMARLRAMASCDGRVTVAVDSDATVDAAIAGGILEVVIDIRVGFRCGCAVGDAARLADRARAGGIEVRGVMGYEGHAMGHADRSERTRLAEGAMHRLSQAHELVGGDIVTGGGTGTWDINRTVNELQAGSYILMDTAYETQSQPFEQGLFIESTVISVAPDYAVCDAGLKTLGMDHGNPRIEGAEVAGCSDEHTIFVASQPVQVGDRVRLTPAHIDPTMAKHRELVMVETSEVERDAEVVDLWPIDLRHW